MSNYAESLVHQASAAAREYPLQLSVVVPVYNSAATLHDLAQRLESVLQSLVGQQYEVIFVNDGSADGSWEIIKEMANLKERLIAVNLMRNFGQHNALMCGFSQARGRYVVTLDDDLQNPPEEIPKLYAAIEQSQQDVVYGVYRHKKHNKFRNLGSEMIQFFYKKTFGLKNRLTAFRIMRYEIIERILSYEKSFTFIDGVVAWYTSHIGTTEVEHHERKQGKSGYSLKRLILLSFNMLTNFSLVPLQVASIIGILFSLVGFAYGSFIVLKKLLWGIPVSGFASIIVSIVILSGVQLLTVGVLGEYIGRIHINVNKKPQYAIRDVVSQQPLSNNACTEQKDLTL